MSTKKNLYGLPESIWPETVYIWFNNHRTISDPGYRIQVNFQFDPPTRTGPRVEFLEADLNKTLRELLQQGIQDCVTQGEEVRTLLEES